MQDDKVGTNAAKQQEWRTHHEYDTPEVAFNQIQVIAVGYSVFAVGAGIGNRHAKQQCCYKSR